MTAAQPITNVGELLLTLVRSGGLRPFRSPADMVRALVESGLGQARVVYAEGQAHPVIRLDRRRLEALLGRRLDVSAMGLALLPPQPRTGP